MTLSLCLLAIKEAQLQKRIAKEKEVKKEGNESKEGGEGEEKDAKYVVWSRIDQKTCLKCIFTAGRSSYILPFSSISVASCAM